MKPLLIITKPDNATVEVQATREECQAIGQIFTLPGTYTAQFKIVLPTPQPPTPEQLASLPESPSDLAGDEQSVNTCVPIINNFLAVCKKAPDPVINQFNRETNFDTTTRTFSTVFYTFVIPEDEAGQDRAKTAWHARLWRIFNGLRWCLLPDRKKLASDRRFKNETWNAITVRVDPEVLKKEPRSTVITIGPRDERFTDPFADTEAEGSSDGDDANAD